MQNTLCFGEREGAVTQNDGKDFGRFIAMKDFFFLIPLLGTAIAMAFDVGYFTGIDINLFTFFSLSEHIVFVLELFPVSVVAASIGFFIGQRIATGSRTAGARRSLPLVGAVLLVVTVVVAIVSRSYFMGAVCAVVVIMSFWLPTPNSLFSLAVAICCITIAFAFSAGHDIAVEYVRGDSWATKILSNPNVRLRIDTKPNGLILGWLIRSGERGVLYVEQDRSQVSLLRWDEIKQISISSRP
jgi:hypothetical protein